MDSFLRWCWDRAFYDDEDDDDDMNEEGGGLESIRAMYESSLGGGCGLGL